MTEDNPKSFESAAQTFAESMREVKILDAQIEELRIKMNKHADKGERARDYILDFIKREVGETSGGLSVAGVVITWDFQQHNYVRIEQETKIKGVNDHDGQTRR